MKDRKNSVVLDYAATTSPTGRGEGKGQYIKCKYEMIVEYNHDYDMSCIHNSYDIRVTKFVIIHINFLLDSSILLR